MAPKGSKKALAEKSQNASVVLFHDYNEAPADKKARIAPAVSDGLADQSDARQWLKDKLKINSWIEDEAEGAAIARRIVFLYEDGKLTNKKRLDRLAAPKTFLGPQNCWAKLPVGFIERLAIVYAPRIKPYIGSGKSFNFAEGSCFLYLFLLAYKC